MKKKINVLLIKGYSNSRIALGLQLMDDGDEHNDWVIRL